MMKHSEEFKQEPVRIALTSGLSRERVAWNLGIGKSTRGKWLVQYRPSDLVKASQADQPSWLSLVVVTADQPTGPHRHDP